MLDLAPFAALKEALGLAKDDPEEYPQLAVIKASVYAALESYCGRSFESDERDETHYLSGERTIPVRALPVTAIASVVVAGTDYTADCEDAADGIRLPCIMSGKAVVTYEGGLEDVPAALSRAALLQTVHEFQRKDAMGASNVSTEGGSVSWPELGLLKEVKRMLDSYTHPAKLI